MKIILLLFLITFPLYSQKVWYRSQLDTGIGNCGPACVAMAIQWATGETKTVEQVRKEIGWTAVDGSTDINQLANNLKQNGVILYNVGFGSINDVKNQLMYKRIVIVLLTMSYIKNRKDSFSGKHFVILSGYDNTYFEVQDPLNGSNVYYKINEVWQAMEKEGLAIWR
jgi:ABC-type bacteriocin/lantibiotic exporter with double-glycine peptidase domain